MRGERLLDFFRRRQTDHRGEAGFPEGTEGVMTLNKYYDLLNNKENSGVFFGREKRGDFCRVICSSRDYDTVLVMVKLASQGSRKGVFAIDHFRFDDKGNIAGFPSQQIMIDGVLQVK